jgi:hypothetical protein
MGCTASSTTSSAWALQGDLQVSVTLESLNKPGLLSIGYISMRPPSMQHLTHTHLCSACWL